MKGPRILIVDDEESVLRACARALSEIPGAQVIQEKLGSRAATLLNSEPFDLLISDVRMPGVDGQQLLRIAHENDEKLPVILITGFPTAEATQGCVSLGAAACLVKPILPDELIATVERVLANAGVDY
jgi:DNA-binding NtrC family response regulator